MFFCWKHSNVYDEQQKKIRIRFYIHIKGSCYDYDYCYFELLFKLNDDWHNVCMCVNG